MSVYIETGKMQIQLDMNFLKGVLVGSAFEGKVPTPSEYILGEVSGGVLGYLGGEVKGYGGSYSDEFRWENWRGVRGFFEGFEGEFSPRLKDSFLRMVEAHNDRSGHDAVTYTELEETYSGNWGCGLRPPYYRSRFPIEGFAKVREIKFDAQEKKDLVGIIEVMKPLVQKDVEFLREHYSW